MAELQQVIHLIVTRKALLFRSEEIPLLYQWEMQPWEFVTEGIANPMDKCTRHLALRDPSDYLLVQYI